MPTKYLDKTVAIVGIGKMGSCIVKNLPAVRRLILVDKNPKEEKRSLVKGKRGQFYSRLGSIKNADIVILALPPCETIDVAKQLSQMVESIIVINVASLVSRKDLLNAVQNRFAVYSVRIIGEATEISKGSSAIFVVEGDNNYIPKKYREILLLLFSRLGDVIFSNKEIYKLMNFLAASETLRAIRNVENVLKQKMIPQNVINVVVRNVMSGTCRTYPWSNNDIFIQKVQEFLKASKSGSPG